MRMRTSHKLKMQDKICCSNLGKNINKMAAILSLFLNSTLTIDLENLKFATKIELLVEKEAKFFVNFVTALLS